MSSFNFAVKNKVWHVSCIRALINSMAFLVPFWFPRLYIFFVYSFCNCQCYDINILLAECILFGCRWWSVKRLTEGTRNHFTEIYRCSEIKGDKVSCPRDRAETECHDTELSHVTRDCCLITAAPSWHYKAAAPVSPPTQSPAAPATHRHHALCWSPVRFFLPNPQKYLMYFYGISIQGCELRRCPHTGRHDHSRGEGGRVRPQQPR